MDTPASVGLRASSQTSPQSTEPPNQEGRKLRWDLRFKLLH